MSLKWRVYSASGRKTNVTPRERTHDESVRAGVSDAPRGVIRGATGAMREKRGLKSGVAGIWAGSGYVTTALHYAVHPGGALARGASGDHRLHFRRGAITPSSRLERLIARDVGNLVAARLVVSKR